jgi:glycosyltransferase involved in cell wall biosynthesis
VFVVDSLSADDTAQLAISCGALVVSGDFDNFATKLNWSLANVDFPTPWVFRLDADELLSEGLLSSLSSSVADTEPDVNGFYVRRQLWFMGQWIKHGGMYPTYSMRLLRKGCARAEMRNLDEHIILSRGIAKTLNVDVIDNPLTDLAAWVDKHNRYSTLEANTVLLQSDIDDSAVISPQLWGSRVARVRWVKVNIFYQLPLFVRPVLYFLYRYVLKLGFLDGRKGLLFHFLHGLWFRVLVDGKIIERRQKTDVL